MLPKSLILFQRKYIPSVMLNLIQSIAAFFLFRKFKYYWLWQSVFYLILNFLAFCIGLANYFILSRSFSFLTIRATCSWGVSQLRNRRCLIRGPLNFKGLSSKVLGWELSLLCWGFFGRKNSFGYFIALKEALLNSGFIIYSIVITLGKFRWFNKINLITDLTI